MKDFVKEYCNILPSVVIYDDEIESKINFAREQLKIAGVTQDETNPVVKEYIATYVRYHMVSEPSKVFVDTETKRMLSLLELLTYGVSV